jgi:hypothetical protein
MDLLVATIADRPDLAHRLDDFPGAWPEFMYHDPVSSQLYDVVVGEYPEFSLIAVDRNAPDRLVAKTCSFPFNWPGDPDAGLPTGGYDAVILRATGDRLTHQPGNLVAAVEVVVQTALQGSGVSGVMLDALRRNTARLGYPSLVVPVRPNRKHEHPDIPMTEYVRWTRRDGLPVDPWLRVHVRAGARIVGIAPRSMTVAGTLDEWRSWTGLPFDTDGPVRVPKALVPVHCDVVNDHAVYVEPNVWVHHVL